MSKGTSGMVFSDYVIYNSEDEVIAIGTREECRERLHMTANCLDTLLSRPLVGWTVVKFWRGKYRCTTQGIADKKVRTFV